MTRQELTELCETWTEYLQCSLDEQNVRWFVRDDGQLMYENEDEDFEEMEEDALVRDINDTFDDFFRDKQWAWIQAEYIDKVLGIDYYQQQGAYLEIAYLLGMIDHSKRMEHCTDEVKERYPDVFCRADYMLGTLR